MAYFEIPNVKVSGLSVCVPKHSSSNLDGPAGSEHERERLVKSTGINFRRFADPGVTCSDLCFEAAEQLLSTLKWKRDEVDALIMVTQSGDFLIPSTSIILQDRLKLSKSTIAFDINLGCSGYPYGLSVIASLVSAGRLRKAILVVGDKSSNPGADRSVSSLFSDCGTATALEFDANAPTMRFGLNSDGAGFKAIYIRSGGGRHPFSFDDVEPKLGADGVVRKGTDVILDGVGIMNFALREVPAAVNNFYEQSGARPEDFDGFIFHQANLLINETIRKKLKLEKDKVPMTLYDFGNTSSASVPITVQQRFEKEMATSKLRLLLCGFGVGLSWATADITFDKAVCLPLIEV